MKKIQDRVALGAIAGLAGGLVTFPIKFLLQKMGMGEKTWAQQATGLTISKSFHRSTSARSIGLLTSLAISTFFGIGQTYLYSVTGKDRRTIKSMEYALFTWLAIQGVGNRLTYTFDARDSSPQTSIASLIGNAINSFVSSYVITNLGDESLFNGEITLTPHHSIQVLPEVERQAHEYNQPIIH